MKYMTETIKRTIVGPYTGKHIAGSSAQIFDALATIEYRFDGFTVTLADIPVRWDEEQQRQFVSGQVGSDMSRKVEDIAYIVERERLTANLERSERGLASLKEQLRQTEQEGRELSEQLTQPGGQDVYERLVRAALLQAPIRASVKTPPHLAPAA